MLSELHVKEVLIMPAQFFDGLAGGTGIHLTSLQSPFDNRVGSNNHVFAYACTRHYHGLGSDKDIVPDAYISFSVILPEQGFLH